MENLRINFRFVRENPLPNSSISRTDNAFSNSFPIFSPFFPILLMLNNPAANLKVCQHLKSVDLKLWRLVGGLTV